VQVGNRLIAHDDAMLSTCTMQAFFPAEFRSTKFPSRPVVRDDAYLKPLFTRVWRKTFSRERICAASFVVRSRGIEALEAAARRFLPAFPDVRHITLR